MDTADRCGDLADVEWDQLGASAVEVGAAETHDAV